MKFNELSEEQKETLIHFVQLHGAEFMKAYNDTVYFNYRADRKAFVIPFRACKVWLDKRVLQVTLLPEVIDFINEII